MTRRSRPAFLALALLIAVVTGSCAITADDHPHPITRDTTTTTIATGP